MKKTLVTGASFFALPLIASAQQLTQLKTLVQSIGSIINAFIPIAIAITVVVFFFGLFQYVRGAGKGHKQGIKIMTAGIIAIFIEVTLWGVIGFVQTSLGIQTPGQVTVPQITQTQL